MTATPDELRAALAAFAWPGVTLEQALADPLRCRLLHARAADLRGRAWRASHQRTRELARRVSPRTGQWITTTHAGPYTTEADLITQATPTDEAPPPCP